MIVAISAASALAQRGARNAPITFREAVKATSGTTAKGRAKDRTTCERISRRPVAASPAAKITTMAGTIATLRVISRVAARGSFRLMKPSITI